MEIKNKSGRSKFASLKFLKIESELKNTQHLGAPPIPRDGTVRREKLTRIDNGEISGAEKQRGKNPFFEIINVKQHSRCRHEDRRNY